MENLNYLGIQRHISPVIWKSQELQPSEDPFVSLIVQPWPSF